MLYFKTVVGFSNTIKFIHKFILFDLASSMNWKIVNFTYPRFLLITRRTQAFQQDGIVWLEQKTLLCAKWKVKLILNLSYSYHVIVLATTPTVESTPCSISCHKGNRLNNPNWSGCVILEIFIFIVRFYSTLIYAFNYAIESCFLPKIKKTDSYRFLKY